MGVVYEYFTYDGKSSRDFEVWISGSGTFDAPVRDVESVSVPGRNGDLHFDNGRFGNIEITYPAFITKDFRHNFDSFKAYILSRHGYKRLEDSYNPEFYRLALYKKALSPEMSPLNRAGSFDISFDCDPRRFLKSGDKTVAISGAGLLRNPTLFEAKPLIRATSTGTYRINNTSFAISSMGGHSYIDIDCELQEAYCGSDNCNSLITLTDGEFPGLTPGINRIIAGGSGNGGALITFNDQCATESVSYDYIQIFFQNGGTWYGSQKLGGKGNNNTLAGAQIYVPSTTFRIYWKSDSSVQDWGFKVDSVVAASSGSDTYTASSFPTVDTLETVYVGADNLPESAHPYGNNEKTGYEVTLITSPKNISITPRWWTI